ncbi:MAG: biphenyl 2,3-dioxygenase, partial [Proteobacteria bacterium]|nr:biphenyl 2,3-dioxygenase [Pseudomonadota bacterium]
MLQSGDFVGYSFWLISMALAAATIFFLMESLRIGGKWATSLTVSALVTFIAAFHY